MRANSCRSGPCPRNYTLWNQKLTDTGSLLFAGMARSHKGLPQRPPTKTAHTARSGRLARGR
jgi:hypothetical protein